MTTCRLAIVFGISVAILLAWGTANAEESPLFITPAELTALKASTGNPSCGKLGFAMVLPIGHAVKDSTKVKKIVVTGAEIARDHAAIVSLLRKVPDVAKNPKDWAILEAVQLNDATGTACGGIIAYTMISNLNIQPPTDPEKKKSQPQIIDL